jgi:hypothetical protein
MSLEDQEGLKAAVFRNTSRDVAWLGYWLNRHQEHDKLDEAGLAKTLGLSMDNYVLLCLCRTPRPDHFREDVGAICRRTGVKELDLVRLLRREQNLEELKRAGQPPAHGWLMAASDRPAGEDQGPSVPEQADDPPKNR